ncbi:MAG: type II secretion system GspH family protein [Planctomycetota bacterium]|jgi:prepilin-type N-terminal cleavage/methylation domain-containing protein|nr:type II secretion system GspH family protein [Planctomycetota bacterium]
MKTQKKSGFTLIELLIVVAIIGILAALLSGPLIRARNTAKLAGCTNNLHQIGLAVATYSSQGYVESAKFPSMVDVYAFFKSDTNVQDGIFFCPAGNEEGNKYGWNPNLNVMEMSAVRIAAADAGKHTLDGSVSLLFGGNEVRRAAPPQTGTKYGDEKSGATIDGLTVTDADSAGAVAHTDTLVVGSDASLKSGEYSY